MMPSKAYQNITDIEKSQIINLYNSGKTLKEIGVELNKPPRTIGKICKHLGLQRNKREAAKIKSSSHLDDPKIVDKIRVLRQSKSLSEIAAIFGSSISAVHRICNKHGIKCEKFNELQAERMKVAWTEEKKQVASKKSKGLITPELRQKLSNNSKKYWQENKYREIQAVRRSQQSHAVSSIQETLYGILDDLNVKYYREYENTDNDQETVVGFYNFDCAIPRSRDTLLIECQGDYWHSINKTSMKDDQKRSYINNNFQGVYELKYLWEHEFKCYNKIVELIKYWLGISKIEIIKFNFADVKISNIQVKTANTLLNKYHYLSGCGRGGICFGAYIDKELIGVCVFSYLVRQNLPFDINSTRELSRFCIHPKYQKKNLGSWFISRAIKNLPGCISKIVSYSDTTFNHNGSLYLASNFQRDGVVRPDYWYVDSQGYVMHKRTLYSHAVKMKMRENEFAELHNYKRVYGTEKIRFVFDRSQK